MPTWALPLVLLGFSASLSNFGGAVGLGVLPLRPRHRVEIVVSFLSMEVLMPLVGLLVGGGLAGSVGSRANEVAGAVLVLLAGYTFVETRRETRDLEIPVKRRTMILLAVALSVDNLAVGMGLGLLRAPVVLAAAFMGLCSLVLTVVGLELGRRLGKRAGDRAELLSALVLFAAGIFVIVHG